MIRTLVATGLIATFITLAFVPPGEASFISLKTRTVSSLLQKVAPLSVVWKEFKSSADPAVVKYLDAIEWAARKGNVRLCPASGDYLVLCLAKVTGDSARCGQIGDDALQSLCQ